MAERPDYFDGDFLRDHLLELSYIVVGIVLFVVFLLGTFPYDGALSGVLAPLGVSFQSGDSEFSFPFGIRMDGVKLSDAADGGRMFFEGDQVRMTPALLALVTGSPGVHLNADAYGGKLKLTARRSGAATALNFTATALNLQRYPSARLIGVGLGGLLSGDGDFTLNQRDMNANHGILHLSETDGSVRLIPGMAPLRLAVLTATIDLEGAKINIQNLETHGGDITLSGRGVIQLDPNLADSEVAIHFQLQVAPTARQRLQLLMGFLPHPPNSSGYFLHGTLGAPSLS